MIKIPTMFVRDESKQGHPVMNQIKPECQWVLDGEGVATQKLDGMNVKIENDELYKRNKPKDRDYDMASYVKCDPENPSDKYLYEAFVKSKNKQLRDGIYEAIGPKIQGNLESAVQHKLIAVYPYDKVLMLENVPRSFDGLKKYLAEINIEGIVFHHPDGRMAKIKKRDFGIKR